MSKPPHQTEQEVRTLDTSSVAAFLELDPGGTVTVYSGKVELGTGVATSLLQIVADELRVPFENVRIVQGDTAETPDQGTTAGSKTLQVAGPVLRRAAREARRELLERAAERLEVHVRDLELTEGVIRTADHSVKIPVGTLAGPPFRGAIESDEPLPADRGSLVGTSLPRVDLLAKLTGGDAYVHDVRLEGMLHGRVIRPYLRTMRGAGRIAAIDDAEARAMPGVIVVRNGDFLGVVAEREEVAIRAAESIHVQWEDGDILPDHATMHDRMRSTPMEETEPVHRGDVDGAMERAARVISSTWRFPVQAHASTGPSCAVADVHKDGATIYTGSQGVYALRQAIAPLLSMDEDRIRMIFREGAGCYGHNGADDVAADAALLSRSVGRPVRVQWMRRDEFAWEPKGPAMLIDMSAALDESGGISAWQHTTWTPTHSTRPGGQPGNLLAGQQMDPPMPEAIVRRVGGDRNAPTTYAIPNERVTMRWLADAPLRPSAFRTLGGFHNTTANEMFLDEIAAITDQDPVALRLGLLGDPRARDVVSSAAARAGWSKPLTAPDGMLAGRGIAFAQYETEYAYVSMVAEVTVDPATGRIRVTRVVAAHDCGRIINPDGVRNQIEGNIIQGISRALKEEARWDDREVTTLTWETYRILTFPEVPVIEIELIDRPDEPSLGAGEPAMCPVAAAIGNAVHDATGVWLRDLPFTPERVLDAMRR
jgi:nicotinate dehydrogenase subunit B